MADKELLNSQFEGQSEMQDLVRSGNQLDSSIFIWTGYNNTSYRLCFS